MPQRYTGQGGNVKSWIVSSSLDIGELKWKCADYVRKSMLIDREYPESLTEYAPDRFAIWSSGSHVLLIVNDWRVVSAL